MVEALAVTTDGGTSMDQRAVGLVSASSRCANSDRASAGSRATAATTTFNAREVSIVASSGVAANCSHTHTRSDSVGAAASRLLNRARHRSDKS